MTFTLSKNAQNLHYGASCQYKNNLSYQRSLDFAIKTFFVWSLIPNFRARTEFHPKGPHRTPPPGKKGAPLTRSVPRMKVTDQEPRKVLQ